MEDIPALENSSDFYVTYRPSFNVLYFAFNYRIAEFRDPLVRQAVSLAIDRQAIVDAFYPNAVAANTFHPPTISTGFNAELQTPYDPELARELLAQAGYPDGLSELNVLGQNEDGTVTDEVVDTIPFQVYVMPVVRPYNPDPEAISTAVADMLAEVGIQAELATAGDWATFLSERSNGNLLGLYPLGWTGDNGDPDNFIGYFFHDIDEPLAREGWYQNAEIAELLQFARSATDFAAREQAYLDAEALLAAESGRVFVAHGEVPLAFNSRVSGFIPSPFAKELYKTVSVN
ncbi:MAG: hypothetical protein HC915_05775 [Anaerolineae bacterium]|nr:hypothetical protein [Anaerolineae bacterium]